MTRRTTADSIDTDLAERLRHAHIDLDIFLACDGPERARRWREDYSTADRENLVRQQLTRRLGDWQPEEVTHWVEHYNQRYGATDRCVPDAAAILDAAKERFDADQRAGNLVGAAQIVRVRQNIGNGARLAWQLGDLLVASLNNPGQVYAVNRRGCTCPNGAAGKSQCWHVALYDLLLDMQQDAADAADARAARADLVNRLASARARVMEAA
jgi:hypothetical protein